MPKTSRTYRLAEDVIAILDRADNATALIESAVRTHAAGGGISLAPDAADILAEIEESGEYVAHLLRDSDRRWRAALMRLRSAGWGGPELRAAIDALNGYWDTGLPATWAAQELHDAQSVQDVCGKWDVDPDRWTRNIRTVADDPELAAALVDVARAFWRGCTPLERRVMG